MRNKSKDQLVPYNMISPGWEVVYAGENDLSKFKSDDFFTYSLDNDGNVMKKYSLWGFAHAKEADWNDEIRYINSMQQKLGTFNDDIRKIRIQIASLGCCDNGVPMTIDEILNAISVGYLPDPAFHAGCWMCMSTRTTQPNHIETMKVIEEVLTGYLQGKTKQEFILKYPYAKGFVDRTYQWLGPLEKFSELQKLMLERILLPFEFFTKHSDDVEKVDKNCYQEGGRGSELDNKISKLASLPKIYTNYKDEFDENLAKITDPQKKEIYTICGYIAHGVRGLSDCHHNTFRYIESFIHGVGTLTWNIPERIKGAEGKRLGQLLFGYALGLDRWLLKIPHQFLLMDLGYIDLGFNPKNEISRVCAYLGEKRTPVNEWLAACLWYKLVLEPPASLYKWGWRHKKLLENAKEKGISIRDWIDSVLHR